MDLDKIKKEAWNSGFTYFKRGALEKCQFCKAVRDGKEPLATLEDEQMYLDHMEKSHGIIR